MGKLALPCLRQAFHRDWFRTFLGTGINAAVPNVAEKFSARSLYKMGFAKTHRRTLSSGLRVQCSFVLWTNGDFILHTDQFQPRRFDAGIVEFPLRRAASEKHQNNQR